MNNAYYRGASIPEPDQLEPLEKKFPYVSENALSFMKVRIILIENKHLLFKEGLK